MEREIRAHRFRIVKVSVVMSASRGWWAMESRIPGHPPGWHLIFDPHLPGWPQLFRTRRECRQWIEEHHGYIRRRPDLQRMGFTMPRPVMVSVVKASADRTEAA